MVLDGAELSYFGQEGMQEVVVGESKVKKPIRIKSAMKIRIVLMFDLNHYRPVNLIVLIILDDQNKLQRTALALQSSK